MEWIRIYIPECFVPQAWRYLVAGPRVAGRAHARPTPPAQIFSEQLLQLLQLLQALAVL